MLDEKANKLLGGQKEDYLDHICNLAITAQMMIL